MDAIQELLNSKFPVLFALKDEAFKIGDLVQGHGRIAPFADHESIREFGIRNILVKNNPNKDIIIYKGKLIATAGETIRGDTKATMILEEVCGFIEWHNNSPIFMEPKTPA